MLQKVSHLAEVSQVVSWKSIKSWRVVSGKRTQGFSVPSNGLSKRAYVAGTATQGGNLEATDLFNDNYIEALRNRTVVGELGATFLPAKVGDMAIPQRTGDNSVTWFGADNSDAITKTTGTIG